MTTPRLTLTERALYQEASAKVDEMQVALLRIVYLIRRLPSPQGRDVPSTSWKHLQERVATGWLPKEGAVIALGPALTATNRALTSLADQVNHLYVQVKKGASA